MKIIISWAVIYFSITLSSAFLHQCGHGLGARLDGIHVSTGFAMTGDPDKKPSDLDFRSEIPMIGRLSSAGLLGPFTNWILAIASLFLLMGLKKENPMILWVAASAIGNAGIRIVPVARFLITAVRGGKLFLDDEATWALASNSNLNFPMSFQQLDVLAGSQPQLLTANPAIYFWPVVSLLISLIVLWKSYRKSLLLLDLKLSNRTQQVVFVAVPFFMGPVVFGVAIWLDEIFRINW